MASSGNPKLKTVSANEPLTWGVTRFEQQLPDRLVAPPNWLAHIPFAFWIVEKLAPRVLVELGVHTGNSYCAFLQAISQLKLNSQCYGIDHWQGDDHAGAYGYDVYEELSAYHDPRYRSFSTLLRSTFDDALSQFSEGTIDLLNIDGFHTYDAASHDFWGWLPKMSSRGVVLLHDINMRDREFGVWQLWDEITKRLPHFQFTHSHGVGVIYAGSEPLSGAMKEFFEAGENDNLGQIRDYFSRLGGSVVDRYHAGITEEALRKASSFERRLDAALKERADVEHALVDLRARAAETDKIKTEIASLETRLQNAIAENCEVKAHRDALILNEQRSFSRRLLRPLRGLFRK